MKQTESFTINSLNERIHDLGLRCRTTAEAKPRLRVIGDGSAPTITLPVTGETRVRVAHDGRRVVLKFGCGLTQAKVLNMILRAPVERDSSGHRYPAGVRYDGEGVLDLEVHLIQDDPLASFDAFIADIEKAGGRPDVDPGVYGYLRSRMRQLSRARVPLRHVIYTPGMASGSVIRGRAKATHVADPSVWGGPVIEKGSELAFVPADSTGSVYRYEVGGKSFDVTPDLLHTRFDLVGDGAWVVAHEGRVAHAPGIAKAYFARANASGITKWLTWDYQLRDLVELAMSPGGAVLAWEMGLGKARLAIALCLLSGRRRCLAVVEAGLVPELVAEIVSLGLPESDWQVIRDPSHAKSLRRINIISYTRLRSPVHPAHPKRTYAKLLRRRPGLLVADEGHVLSDLYSQQTGAVWTVSAGKRFIFTGSPIANYPRDIHALLALVSGDGTAEQPYGVRRVYLEPRLRNSMTRAYRGLDKFREDFVTLEWVTNEFADTLRQGAKREIPKIANLVKYRETLSTHVLRRVVGEPEVAAFVPSRKPEEKVSVIEWDDAHLAHYLTVADEFRRWYMQRHSGSDRKRVNLVATLARIQAVEIAGNFPQYAKSGKRFAGLTSKQRYTVNRLSELASAGHKVVLFARNPGVLQLLATELSRIGVPAITFHGGKSIGGRMEELNTEFRHGDCPILLSSYVGRTGLNIPQANWVVFYNRAWTYLTEYQAGRRVLRPQQQNNVTFEYFHLAGGIDEYQAQMVAHKRDAFHAGLDYCAPVFSSDETFLHLDTILGRFCEDLASFRGISRTDLRQALVAA